MKNIFLLICSCVFCFVYGHASSNNSLYYYSLGKKCELSRIESKLAFQKNSNISREDFIQTLPLQGTIHNIEWRGNDICLIEYKDTFEVSQFKRDLLSRGLDSIIIWPVYTINHYTEAILFREILVKPKSFVNIDTLITRYGLKLKSDKGNYLVYSVPKDSDVVLIANQIYETGTCEFSYPHFGTRVQSFSHIPNDTYFPYQITCHNTGQTLPNGHFGSSDADIDAPEAWDITKGSPDIVVAVFDEGVTSNHPDLPNNRQVRLNGSNFGSGNVNDPSPTGNNNHGNACAGVIAATMDNNEGIAGIAPNCKIMPLRWDAASSDAAMADGIYFAINNGANIISCSWGYTNPSYTSDVVYNAINTAIAQNVIVIFAAGNDGYVAFPANANIANLITVGASDRYDMKAYYSAVSPQIDIVAPSHRAYSFQISDETFEMYSLDIPGNYGYNPIPSGMDDILVPGTFIPNFGTNYLSYTGCFGGTSHACPVVAGVVALMLSVNPYLTPSTVFDILKETSDKVGGYTYVSGKCDEMGYGRVNAYAAVAEAKSRYIQGPNEICDGDTAMYYLVHPSQPGETVQWQTYNGVNLHPSFSIVGDAMQDTVYVKCQYLNPRIWDPIIIPVDLNKYLSVTINSNNGTTSETYKKYLSLAHSEVPTISASNTATIWLSQTQRIFTVTNCSDVPNESLKWTVKRKRTFPMNPSPHIPTEFTSYYYGRTLSYSPPTPDSMLYPDTLTINATNLDGACGPAQSNISFQFIVIPRKWRLIGHEDGELLLISISEETGEQQRSPAHLDEDSEYTLELWHSLSGSIRTQRAFGTNEQMSIRGIPQGVYVLLLKANGNIVANTKVLIQ